VSDTVHNAIRRLRAQRGQTQQEFADQVGISRQSLVSIEAGKSQPSTAVALRIARALNVRMDQLFWLDSEAELTAEVAEAGGLLGTGADTRVALSMIAGRWVAHPIGQGEPGSRLLAADGLALSADLHGAEPGQTVRVRPLTEPGIASQRLIVMGCAPPLGPFSTRLAERYGDMPVTWLHRSSGAALEALERAQAHVAGVHYRTESTGADSNLSAVQERFADQPVVVVNLVSWEAGLVTAPGNPHGIRGIEDLARREVRFVQRETGSGARHLLVEALREKGLTIDDIHAGPRVAVGHMLAARSVALGAGDAAITIRSAAMAFGLEFLPLAHERFDLVIRADLVADARIERLLDTLGSRAFRRELDSLGGYESGRSGEQLLHTGGG
jgi:molybdate-binding protein/DNA-binding XRE family transcriptional regulator